MSRVRALLSRNGGSTWAWLMLIPAFLLVLALVAYPLMTGISLSMRQVILTRPDLGRPFVGIDNFLRMLADPVVARAALNTALYTVVGVSAQFALGLGAALLLSRPGKWMWIPRTLVMLPWFLPPIAAANVFAFMIDPQLGILTELLGRVGIDIGGAGVLATPGLALFGVLGVELWQSYPFFALFLLAGLQGIPPELREASALDGAGPLRHFAYVSWPLLRPVVIISTLLGAMQLANSPTMLLLMTGGGPGGSTQVLSLYAFQQAYQNFDFGYSSAIAVSMLVVVVGFAAVYLKASGGGRLR